MIANHEQMQMAVSGAIDAMLFANVLSNDEKGESVERRGHFPTPTRRNELAANVINFVRAVCSEIGGETERSKQARAYIDEHGWFSLGSDFVLSASGHGAGFFDRGSFDRLQEEARIYSLEPWLDGTDVLPYSKGSHSVARVLSDLAIAVQNCERSLASASNDATRDHFREQIARHREHIRDLCGQCLGVDIVCLDVATATPRLLTFEVKMLYTDEDGHPVSFERLRATVRPSFIGCTARFSGKAASWQRDQKIASEDAFESWVNTEVFYSTKLGRYMPEAL